MILKLTVLKFNIKLIQIQIIEKHIIFLYQKDNLELII